MMDFSGIFDRPLPFSSKDNEKRRPSLGSISPQNFAKRAANNFNCDSAAGGKSK
jgi:hypothetical protein